MAEKPILFSGEMVRAILAGRKTQTRRIVKGSEDCEGMDAVRDRDGVFYRGWWSSGRATQSIEFIPKVNVGDTLWVRETWGLYNTEPSDGPENAQVYYQATDGERHDLLHQRWRPSIHMPRWASRLTLEVTAVRVERLQDISGSDAKAEGCEPDWDAFEDATCGMEDWEEPEEFIEECEEECDWINFGHGLVHATEHKEWIADRKSYALRLAFRKLWESINGPESWAANPWVWVYEFEKGEVR